MALDCFQLWSLMLAILKTQTVSNKRTYEASYILYIHFKRHRFSCRTSGCLLLASYHRYASSLPVTGIDVLEFVVKNVALGALRYFPTTCKFANIRNFMSLIADSVSGRSLIQTYREFVTTRQVWIYLLVLSSFFYVFSTVHHSIDLFHLPNFIHNSFIH